MIPNPISFHLFPLRNESSRSTVNGWKHSSKHPFAPVLTTEPTGLITSLWVWIRVLGASCIHLVSWTLLRYGCSQISMSRTIGIMLTPSMLHSRTLAMSQKLLLGLLSHGGYSSRKRRNKETQKRQTKSLKLAECVTKRKLMAQPEISRASAEQVKSREPRTVEQVVGSIHASHQRALLQEHSNVFCSQCGAVNAGGSLRLLKSQCDGTGESRRKAWRKAERGLMLNALEPADARRSFLRFRWREFLQRRLLPCSVVRLCQSVVGILFGTNAAAKVIQFCLSRVGDHGRVWMSASQVFPVHAATE